MYNRGVLYACILYSHTNKARKLKNAFLLRDVSALAPIYLYKMPYIDILDGYVQYIHMTDIFILR